MAQAGTAWIPFQGDFSNLQRDARRQGDRAGGVFAGGFDKKSKAGILSGFRGIAGAAAGIFAGAKIVGVFSDFIEEGREAAKVGRVTANAIKQTGGAAKISAAGVADLAESLSNKSGIDDEVIQTGANLLLTFKQIRNEAGAGNDVFNRAAAAATDLSVQFGSVDSASKMLGKALNDPVKGISALSRAGVTFTEDQKNAIRVAMEHNDVLIAQRIILGEVESQVGGAAAAAADPMAKLSVVIGNLKERIGGALLPAIGTAATWLGKALPGALEAAGTAWDILRWKTAPYVPILLNVIDQARMFFNAFRTGFTEDEGTRIERIALLLRDGLGTALGWLTGTALPALRTAAETSIGWLTGTAFPAVRDGAQAAFGWLSETAIPAVTGAWSDLTEAFNEGTGEGGIANFGRGARVALTWISETGIPAVHTALDGIVSFFQGDGGDAIGGAFGAYRDYIMWARDTWGKVFAALPGLLRPALDTFQHLRDSLGEAVGPVMELVTALGTALAPVLKFVWPIVRNLGIAFGVVAYVTHRVFLAAIDALATGIGWFTKTILPALTFYIENVMTPAIQFWSDVFMWVWERIGGYLLFVWNSILKPVFGWLSDYITTVVIPAYTKVWEVAQWVWAGVSAAVSTAWEKIEPIFNLFKEGLGTVATWVGDKVGAIAGFFSGIADTIWRAFGTAFNGIANLWNNTVGKLSWDVPDWIPVIGGKTVAAPQMPVINLGGNTGPMLEIEGARAKGGPVMAHRPYLVGEQGPELFMPQTRGAIVAHRQLMEDGSYRQFDSAGRQIFPHGNQTASLSPNFGRVQASSAGRAIASSAARASSGSGTTIEIPVYLDGREIGRSRAVYDGIATQGAQVAGRFRS